MYIIAFLFSFLYSAQTKEHYPAAHCFISLSTFSTLFSAEREKCFAKQHTIRKCRIPIHFFCHFFAQRSSRLQLQHTRNMAVGTNAIRRLGS